MTVLDLDLDFFVSPVRYSVPEVAERPPDEECRVWSSGEVAALLERLGWTGPVPGRLCERHVEALWVWNEAAYAGRLELPFRVIHVDAHEDLGWGDPAWERLQEEVLVRPTRERSFAEVGALAHSGNFLLCAVALGWVSELILVLPEPLAADPAARLRDLSAHDLHFAGGDPASGRLQLKAAPGLPAAEQAARARETPWEVVDTPVPVRVLGPGEIGPEALGGGGIDLVTVARSPAFCPPRADALLPLLERRIRGGPFRRD